MHSRLESAFFLKDILAAVGNAVWHAQVVERAVAAHLVIVYGESDETARARAAEAFDTADKKTLGALLSKIKKAGPRDGDLLERLDAFRDERNWVVHHSRHHYPDALYDVNARAALVKRLNDLADAAAPLGKEVQDATDDYLVASGVRTREQLSADAARIRASWQQKRRGTQDAEP